MILLFEYTLIRIFRALYTLQSVWAYLKWFLMSGDIKKVISQKTGLEPNEQRLLFRGKEKEDEEHLHMAGVKDNSKVLLMEEPATKEKKVEEVKKSSVTSKASEAIAGVRLEVDKLSEKVIPQLD